MDHGSYYNHICTNETARPSEVSVNDNYSSGYLKWGSGGIFPEAVSTEMTASTRFRMHWQEL